MKHQLKHHVFIVDGLRTATGSPFKSLKKYSPPELAGEVIRSLLRKTKVKKKCIDEVLIGNVVGAGLGQNMARQATLAGGLPVSVPAVTVNNVCGAGLQAVVFGARALLSGQAKLVICGGAESATHNPYYIEGDMDQAFNPRDVQDSLIQDGLICPLTKKHMGELVEAMAKHNHISRRDQDLFALESHLKAIRAQDKKIFQHEIVPIKLTAKKFFREDERPRRRISIDNFETLRPAFVRGGSVTAGNASAPSDGAAACLLASKAAVKTYGLKPRARILAEATVATDPSKAFEACIESVRAVLRAAGMTGSDIDLYEIAESFAAQVLLTQKKLRIPHEKLNIYGGDLACGHPRGAAGVRSLVTLLTGLRHEKGRFGVVTIAFGGGGSTALLVERLEKV